MVCREHDGPALSVTKEKVPDLTSSVRVHSRRGFIKNDGARVTDEGQEDGELSLHTSRQVLGELGLVGKKIDFVQPAKMDGVGEFVCVCVCVCVCDIE